MGGRLEGKTALVVGGGQTPGATIGNGRATSILYAREGARVVVADLVLDSAKETVAMIEDEGGEAFAAQVDVRIEGEVSGLVAETINLVGRIDVLQNNVGIGAGDGSVTKLEEAAWDRIFDVNLKGTWLTCKHALPAMRRDGGGAIVNISSIAAIASINLIAYKTSKAGVNALTQQLALSNARFGIRVNAIMPGLMDTPMAVDSLADALGQPREEIASARDAFVPLGQKMGDAWDVARASLFLASDEARFITGAVLPVDGGQSCRVG